jgi:cellulose synthase/poly-beta-1,6-N-acetylglucosamine synthase-like glycosyltransferase
VLFRSLTSLKIQNQRKFETILVDGGSQDSTIEKAWDVVNKIVFVAEASRKGQENVGAGGARGEVLLFLHADMVLSPDAIDRIAKAMVDPAVAGGSCRIAFDARGFRYSFLSAFRTCGSRLLRLHGISSAFFVRRSLLLAAGGFREDVMEEAIDLVRRLPGSRFVTLDITVLSSARRFERRDLFFVAALWSLTVLLTLVGVRRTGLERKLWKSIR